MEDILAQAINDRLEERRMADFTTDKQFDYKVRRDFILAEFNSSTDLTSEEEFFLRARDKIDQLFLDTIEKAKPEELDESVMASQPIGGRPNFGGAREAAGYNDGVAVFESNLKKEIGN